MKYSDAAMIFGLSGHVTPDDVNRAYREAAKRYHPDINPAGAEMMMCSTSPTARYGQARTMHALRLPCPMRRW